MVEYALLCIRLLPIGEGPNPELQMLDVMTDDKSRWAGAQSAIGIGENFPAIVKIKFGPW